MDVQKDAITRSEILVGRECHSIHTTVERVPWSAYEQTDLIWKAVWRLRFTYTWMCRSILETGRESRKASRGWYRCRNLKYEWRERVILYTGNSMQQKHACNRKLNYVEKNHKEFWIVEQSKDKVVKFCLSQLMKDFICMVKVKERRMAKGENPRVIYLVLVLGD